MLIKKGNILIATFVPTGFDGGDSYGLVFKDTHGKLWDFGSGENNLSEDFDFIVRDDNAKGGESSNPELVGKKFKIIWENKKVKSFDMSGENVIEIDALSIVSVELAKIF